MFNLQNVDWKKIAIIAGFIVICLVIAYFIYSLFFKPALPPALPAPEEGVIGQLPGADEGLQPGLVGEEVGEEKIGVEKVTPKAVTKIPAEPLGVQVDQIAKGGLTKVITLDYEPAAKITLDSTGDNAMIYNADSGKFYTVDDRGNKVSLSDKTYKDVQNIAWSPTKDQAILEFPDSSNILFNFKTEKQISLPKDWSDFSFSPTGSKIAFKDLNQNKEYRFMGIANADGSGQNYLEYMGDDYKDFKIDWSPNNKMIAQYKTGETGSTAKLYFVGQYDEKFKAITVNGYALETAWTPDGSKLVYSAQNAFSDHKPLLHVVDAVGDSVGYNHNSLKLNTWASKCTFESADIMYCAVPKEMPYGAGLVPRLADDIPDYIYKVNLQTGVKSFIAEPQYGFTIEQMQVSEDGSNLYFTDKETHEVHLMKLK